VVSAKSGLGKITRGDDRPFLTKQVQLGVKVSYSANAGVDFKKLPQRGDIADPICKVAEVEPGDDLNASRGMTQQPLKGTNFYEWTDNSKLAGIIAKGLSEFLIPFSVNQPESHIAYDLPALHGGKPLLEISE
jgi:hypothetical protein